MVVKVDFFFLTVFCVFHRMSHPAYCYNTTEMHASPYIPDIHHAILGSRFSVRNCKKMLYREALKEN